MIPKNAAPIDNSVLTKLRLKNNLPKNEDHISTILKLLQVRNITSDDIIIYNEIFIEIIGQGKIKKEIADENKPEIKDLKEEVKSKIINNSTFSFDDIARYFNYLHDIFYTGIKKKLPQYSILDMTNKNINSYPFIKELSAVNDNIIDFARILEENNNKYEALINNITNNASINYLYHLVNVDEIKNKNDEIRAQNEKRAIEYGSKCNNFLFEKDFRSDFNKHTENIHQLIKNYFMPIVSGFAKIHAKIYNNDAKNLIEPEKDLVDGILISHMFLETNKEHPITILTCDPIEIIKKRMIYFCASLIEIKKQATKLCKLIPSIADLIKCSQNTITIIDLEKNKNHSFNLIEILKETLKIYFPLDYMNYFYNDCPFLLTNHIFLMNTYNLQLYNTNNYLKKTYKMIIYTDQKSLYPYRIPIIKLIPK